jgi:two-component system, NtrC family, sensor kinase
MINEAIVSTIRDRCKRCYSCIRECPGKAIRVINGQAAVLPERCIACGHCVKVCSQNAKQIHSQVDYILEDIIPGGKSFAVVAPSFAASFPSSYNKLPSALRKLGFTYVMETAFGADLISSHYLEEFQSEERKTVISSSCPAVVSFIEKYYIELVPKLAPVVSPMIAIGKYIKHMYGEDSRIVFIGPCTAKKKEALYGEVADVIDAVLTFTELKEIFRDRHIDTEKLQAGEFDPPHATMGKSFPLAGGLLKTAGISSDILEKEIIIVEGKKKVVEIIEELSEDKINAKFVDILFCEGCISGPAIDSDLNYYSRRETVVKYIQQKLHTTDKQLWKSNLYNSRNLNLKRKFTDKRQRKPYPSEERIREILAETNKYYVSDELNCGACGYNTCREYAVAIAKDLAEKDMCLPFLIDKLAKAYDDLKNTQEQLQSAEKLASIGQLAAGVAHEINNPLGTILLYASMLQKETGIKDNVQHNSDLELILEETNRCKNIVSNLLNFARQGKLKVSSVNLALLLNGIIKNLQINPLNRDILFNFDIQQSDPFIEGDQDQLRQVFINILNNACESMEDSGEKILGIRLCNEEEYLSVEIMDTGAGIPKENFSKIFTPFFTTKKIGKGTGLGLAIAYGIIKMHKGHINFSSSEGKGTVFTIRLPRNFNSVNMIRENS